MFAAIFETTTVSESDANEEMLAESYDALLKTMCDVEPKSSTAATIRQIFFGICFILTYLVSGYMDSQFKDAYQPTEYSHPTEYQVPH